MFMVRTIVAMAAGSFLVAACGGNGGTEPPPAGGPSTPAPISAQVAMVSGEDPYGDESHSFDPQLVTIQRTGTVTWANNSGVAHNVTFNSQQGAPSHLADMTGGSASRTFNTAGEFNYSCTNHPGMLGQVIVED